LTILRLYQTLILAVLCVCIPGTAASAQATKVAGAILHVAISGSDGNPCTESAPCATINRAYQVASPGQAVWLDAGDYPAQLIKADSRKTSQSRVVLMAAPGAQVKIAGVSISGSHVELRNLQTSWHVLPGADGVTLRNIVADGAVFITGASNVSVLGGQVFSPVPVASDSQIASIQGKVPTNILLDGVSFHDFQDVGPGNFHHIECLQVGAAINLTVRNSSFRNCATHDIFIRSWGMTATSPSPLSKITLENNFFAKTTDGFYSVQILDDLWKGSPSTSFDVRNNSALGSILVRVFNGTAQVRGNIIPAMAGYFCDSYGQKKWFDYNLYGAGVACGPHDRIGDPRFVDPASLDLRVHAGSAAVGQGDPLNHPPLDIDGKLRPVRARPDAGASQRENADIAIGKSLGSARFGEGKTEVVQFYGAPRRTSTYRGVGPRGTVATYSVRGGLLRVLYDVKGTVVGLGTTSSYYSTRAGEGVGVPWGRLVSTWKLHWLGCQKAYRKNVGTVALYVAGRHGKAPGPVASIWMVKRAFDGCGRRPR
jgi:hypothetical protein